MASNPEQYADHTTHHIIPPKVYFIVFLLLMVLTFLTVFAATFDLGALNTPIALAIAVTKASLVFLFFMGVRWYAPMLKTVAIAGFVFFGIMVGFTMSDFVSRDWAGGGNVRSLEPAGGIPVGTDPQNEVPEGRETAQPAIPTSAPDATPVGTPAPLGGDTTGPGAQGTAGADQ